MKVSQLTILILSFLLFNSSCKNDDIIQEETNPTNTPTIKLSKVINNIVGDPGYGKPIIEFFYMANRLTTSINYGWVNNAANPFKQTTIYNYNNSSQLIGSNLSYLSPSGSIMPYGNSIVSTTVNYDGNNISEIKTYENNNILFGVYKFNYVNNKVNKIDATFTNQTVFNTLNIDATGNYLSVNSINSYAGNTYNSNSIFIFDNNKNIVNTLPFWQYFYTGQYFNTSTNNPGSLGLVNGIFFGFPNVNNVISTTNNNYTVLYTFQIGSNDYPSISTVSYSGINQSYKYEYVTN
jgi:hypothetical protein